MDLDSENVNGCIWASVYRGVFEDRRRSGPGLAYSGVNEASEFLFAERARDVYTLFGLLIDSFTCPEHQSWAVSRQVIGK